jgi:hypothetical protein
MAMLSDRLRRLEAAAGLGEKCPHCGRALPPPKGGRPIHTIEVHHPPPAMEELLAAATDAELVQLETLLEALGERCRANRERAEREGRQ